MKNASAPTHSGQQRLQEAEYRQHQVTGQQGQSLHAAAQRSPQRVRGGFDRLAASELLHQDAETNPLVPGEVGGDAPPLLQHSVAEKTKKTKQRTD